MDRSVLFILMLVVVIVAAVGFYVYLQNSRQKAANARKDAILRAERDAGKALRQNPVRQSDVMRRGVDPIRERAVDPEVMEARHVLADTQPDTDRATAAVLGAVVVYELGKELGLVPVERPILPDGSLGPEPDVGGSPVPANDDSPVASEQVSDLGEYDQDTDSDADDSGD